MEENRLTLDTPEQVFFYEQDHYYLSNFSAFQVRHKGHTFQTSEHAYQWMKFEHTAPTIATQIQYAASAHEAFTLATTFKHRRVPDWDLRKEDEMFYLLASKAHQHEYVYRKLLQTGDRELVENSWRDDYWGWGPQRNGQNMLGRLWMRVRAGFMDGSIPAPGK